MPIDLADVGTPDLPVASVRLNPAIRPVSEGVQRARTRNQRMFLSGTQPGSSAAETASNAFCCLGMMKVPSGLQAGHSRGNLPSTSRVMAMTSTLGAWTFAASFCAAGGRDPTGCGSWARPGNAAATKSSTGAAIRMRVFIGAFPRVSGIMY